jgi:hypothetical protein
MPHKGIAEQKRASIRFLLQLQVDMASPNNVSNHYAKPNLFHLSERRGDLGTTGLITSEILLGSVAASILVQQI